MTCVVNAQETPCRCVLERISLESVEDKKLSSFLREHQKNFNATPWALNNWGIMFSNIFGNSIYTSPLETIHLHLIEEIEK